MNRKQKRDFINKARKKGIKKSDAIAYLATQECSEIKEGDKVKLNVSKIKASPDYPIMRPDYKEFVEKNVEKIFTAHYEKEVLVSLVEEPKWLFWRGNLIKVNN